MLFANAGYKYRPNLLQMIKSLETWNSGLLGAAESENLFLMIIDLKFLLRIPRERSLPVNIYLFRVNNRNTRKDV